MPFCYRTELTQRILKSPQARRILSYLSPVYGDAYVMLWLIQITGGLLDQLNNLTQDHILQAFPQTATWSIGRWEDQCGAKPDPAWDLSQRRWAVIAREKPTTPMGPRHLEEIATNAAGVPVQIEENTGPNRFRVTFWEEPEGLPANRRGAYRELDSFKPAHLSYAAQLRMPPVELDNWQAFYFTSLLTYLSGVHARTAYLFDAFQLLYKVKNTDHATPSRLSLYTHTGWRMQSRPELTVTARANNWGAELIRLDGRRRLDGSWRLNQHLAKGLALGQLTVWAGIRNRQEVKPAPASMLLG